MAKTGWISIESEIPLVLSIPLTIGRSEKYWCRIFYILRCTSTRLNILWVIHVNFGCPSFSVIMKFFAIFWVVNLRRLTALGWCCWLGHMFHIFKHRWQHIVIKGGCCELRVVRKWAISKSCTNGLDYFFCDIRSPQDVWYQTCIILDPI